MSYYEEIVANYLSHDRACFVSQDLFINLNTGKSIRRGESWYVDVAAVSFSVNTIFLCEASYSQTLYALFQRLAAWNNNWDEVKARIKKQSKLPDNWGVQPWVFTPESLHTKFEENWAKRKDWKFEKKWTSFEDIAPWKIGDKITDALRQAAS